jgi:membrane glycosyltransferase
VSAHFATRYRRWSKLWGSALAVTLAGSIVSTPGNMAGRTSGTARWAHGEMTVVRDFVLTTADDLALLARLGR